MAADVSLLSGFARLSTLTSPIDLAAVADAGQAPADLALRRSLRPCRCRRLSNALRTFR